MANRLAEHQGRVPQPGVPTGKRNRRRPVRNRVAEHQGRTPQPGVPTGSRNAPRRTKAERRNAAVRAALQVKTPSPKAKTPAERRREAAAVAVLRSAHLGRGVKPPRPTVATASQRSTISKGPSKGELLELAVDKGVVKPLQAEGKLPKHKTLGQDIYDKVAQVGIIALPEAAELKAGAEGVAAVLRGATDAEGTKIGGSKLLSKVLKPTEATTAEGRQAILSRAAEKAATRESSGVRAAVRRVASKTARTDARADAAVARRVAGKSTRREAVAAAGAPLKAAKVSAAQALPVVQGHEQAVLENPGKVAKTTARALPGLVTAPVGQAVALGVSGGRAASEGAHALGIPGARGYSGSEIAAPLVGVAKEQLDFAQEVAKTITATDSAEVQKAVEDELGLLLPITLGLGGKALGEKISKGRITEAVRSVVEQARSRFGRGHGHHGGRTPRVLEGVGQHKAEAQRIARHKTRSERERHDRTSPILREARKVKGSAVVRRAVGPRRGLRGRPADLEVHGRDVVGFAVRHALPLDKPDEALAEVKRIGAGLRPLKGELPKDRLHTRDLIAFIEANPAVLADPHLAAAVDRYRSQAKAARETPGIEPEHSERARFTPTAVTRGVPLADERFPLSIRGDTRAEPERGVAAKDVLRREAKADRRRSKRLARKASTRENRARIVGRELALRDREPLAVDDRLPADVRVKQRRLDSLKAKAQRLRGELGQRERSPETARGDLRQVVKARRSELLDAEADIRGIEAELPGMVDGHRDAAVKAAEDLRSGRRHAAAAKAARLGSQAEIYRRGATKATDLATRKRRAAYEIDPAVEQEFLDDMRAHLAAEGKPEPEYVNTGRGRETPTYGATGAKLTNPPGRSKRRRGTADEYGTVQEDLGHALTESITRPISRRESYAAMRGFLKENEFRPVGHEGPFEVTSDQARKLFDDGDLARDRYVLVPRQMYDRAYGKFDPARAAAEIKASLDGEAPGRKFKLVRRAAAEEFFDQLTASFSPRLAKINQITSGLILRTSPAWAAAQIVAEYSQAAVAQSRVLNPRFVKRAVAAYKSLAPHERQAFDAWVGVTTRALESPDDLRTSLGTGDMEAASGAIKAMDETPLGKVIMSIPRGIGKIDEWKGGRIRMLTAAAKIDSEFNGRGGKFLRGVAGLHDEIAEASKAMADLPLDRQLAYVTEHPALATHVQHYLDDVMGNWSALTKRERGVAGLAIFYPFLRMSLRWTLYAFPRHHPVKAAILYWLGQANAQHLHELLGQDPSYFSEWATVPLDLGDGKQELIPLSRIAPGSNALVEALGEATDPKQVVMRSLQPGVAAAVTALTGVSGLTGKQKPHSAVNALASLMTLSAPGRVLDEHLVGAGRKRADGALPFIGGTERQQSLDKLFAVLEEKGTATRAARTVVAPMLPERVDYERDLARLKSTLEALEANSSDKRRELGVRESEREEGKSVAQQHKIEIATFSRASKMAAAYEAAQRRLDALLRKYKVPADEWTGRAYGAAAYLAKPKNVPPPGTLGGRQVGTTQPGSSTPTPRTIGGRPARGKLGAPTTTGAGRLPPAGTLGGVKVR